MIFLLEVLELPFEFDDLVLDHLDCTLIVIIVNEIFGYNKVLITVWAVILLPVPGDQIAILSYD